MAEGNRRDDATIVAGARSGSGRSAPDREQAGARFFGNDERYQVTAVLGRGGFGTVYKAYDHRLAKYVAVKMINISDIPERERQDYIRAFDNEAKIAAQLEHPGIVTVIDYDPYTEEPYLVMPLVECGTLKDWFAEHPRLPWPQVVELGIQMAEALEYAYRHGVHTHRDIKPANIFCAPDGRYKLGDFGIARRQRSAGAGLTKTAFFAAGTPRYMAPEQIISPRAVDSRSDLFALCVVLYEALTGKQPFRGVSLEFDPDENPTSAKKIVDAAYEPPEAIRKLAPDVPADVARLIERGLSRDPRDRFASAGEFAQALKKIDASPRAQIRQIATRVGVVLLLAGLGVVVFQQREILWRTARDLFGTVAGHSSELLSRVNVDKIDPQRVIEAQRRAREAHGDRLVYEVWERAEEAKRQAEEFAARRERANADDARQRALDLYARAEREAWASRVKTLGTQVEDARKTATTSGIPPGSEASKLFDAAEDNRRRALSASTNPAEATRAFEAALAKYNEAVSQASAQSSSELTRRVESIKSELARIPQVVGGPRDVAEELERTKKRLEEAEAEVAAGRADSARTILGTLEGKVHELVVDTTIALRRRLVKLRSDYKGSAEAVRRKRAETDPTFNRAVERLASARSTGEYFEVLAMLDEVRTAYEGPRRAGSVASDEEAVIAAADSLRAEAESVRANVFPRARIKLEKGLKQLGDARQMLSSNPKKASDLAKAASISFIEARDSATQEAETLQAEVPAKRAVAQRARAQAEKAGAPRNPHAAEVLRKAAAAMESAEESIDTTPGALAQRASAYDEAARWFSEAEKIALESAAPAVDIREPLDDVEPPPAARPAEPQPPPRAEREPVEPVQTAAFDVRQRPPANEDVIMYRGEAIQFWADTKVKGADFAWYFNGKEVPFGRGYPGVEIAAPGNYPDGRYKLIVQVTDAQGREVSREWTVRIASP